ncbi:hypothetical protein Tco_0421756 [Tanacetum coccineum]
MKMTEIRLETSIKTSFSIECVSTQILLSRFSLEFFQIKVIVKINLYVLTQLFTEFDKTCKKRITPTGVLVSNVNDRSCEPYNANDVTDLFEQNEHLRAEIEKIEDLKAQLEGNLKVATRSSVKTKVLAPGMYAIDVKPIPHPLKNNRSVHLTYINHLKESVENCGTDHLMVFGLRLFKTYDGESLKAQELCEKVHQDGNNHVGAIMGYGDYMIGDSVVSRAYYVEGLGHNLFSVGQFCDSDLEVAFRKHSCFVRNMDGVDLLKGWCSTNLYTIFVDEMLRSSPICLLSKASKNKSWLWHRRLKHCHLNDRGGIRCNV